MFKIKIFKIQLLAIIAVMSIHGETCRMIPNDNHVYSSTKEAYDDCVLNKNANTCTDLASFREEAKDYKAALLYYTFGVDYGDCSAFYNLGRFYKNGYGVLEKDLGHAFYLYDTACKGGSPKACAAMSWMFETSGVVPVDIERSKMFMKKSCDLGYQEACVWHKQMMIQYK